MKKIFSTTVALAVMAIFISTSHAAINIDEATIENGQVFIAGNQAQKRAAISWEGVTLGINSNNGGAFEFNTTNLPEDCVGRLKVGTEERDVVINNCTPTPITVIEAGVPKTGQTTIFATGDDGDLEKGVAWPNPRFTDNLNGTITDNLTALIWLKNANCIVSSNSGFDNDGTAGDGRVTWQHALDFVAGINNDTYDCGDTSNAGFNQTDWRLPNRNELTSLLDLGRSNPALPLDHPFTSFLASSRWSSTTVASTPSNAWEVIFLSGGVSTGGVAKTNVGFVTAVRGGS